MTNKTATAAVDLSAIEAAISRQDDGIDVPLVGLDGKTPLGIKIRVAGPDSARAIAAQEAQTDDLLERQDAGKPNAKQLAERGIAYLARVTIDWSPAIKIDGEERAYSEENAVLLYSKFRFIKEQVDRAAGNRARFMIG